MKDSTPDKILYVENGIGYGGAIICLRHLIRELDRTKFEPVVVTSRTGSQYRQIATEAKWYYFPDRMIDTDKLVRRIHCRQSFKSHSMIRAIAIQLLARFDDVVNFLPFFCWLLLLTLRIRPQLIHLNNEPLCNRAGIFIGLLMRIPIICHVRGNLEGSRMMRWLYRLPDHFITVSHWVAEGIGAFGVPSTKKTVVYDGISLDHIDRSSEKSTFRKRFGVPEDAFVVGLVGMLIPWKGQHLFIDAFMLNVKRIPNLVIILIGGPPENGTQFERELKQRVDRDGIAENVIFTGHINDMYSAYNSLDVVVSASTSPEPLGTMVIECMAMGRPLVVPNHGGGAEMNTHMETALFFENGNAESLAQSIFDFYQSAELRGRLGRRARMRALAKFDVANHAREVEKVYDKVMGRTI